MFGGWVENILRNNFFLLKEMDWELLNGVKDIFPIGCCGIALNIHLEISYK